MGLFSAGNRPGFTSITESAEGQVWWSGPDGQHQRSTQDIQLLAGEVDSGNTPTSTLRAGNLLGTHFGTRNVYVYDPDNNIGAQLASGVLEHSQSMLVDNTSTERFTKMLVTALLHRTAIVGLDAQAEAQLIRAGFRFDDAEVSGAAFLVHPKAIVNKAVDYTVVAADNGKRFVANKAGFMTFTLPTIAAGLTFDFLQLLDQAMILGATGLIVHKGASAADTVGGATASEQLGTLLRVTAQYVGSTPSLKWVIENLGGTTITVS